MKINENEELVNIQIFIPGIDEKLITNLEFDQKQNTISTIIFLINISWENKFIEEISENYPELICKNGFQIKNKIECTTCEFSLNQFKFDDKNISFEIFGGVLYLKIFKLKF